MGKVKVSRQRHTASEIATKLAMADDLLAQGRLHSDIARSLGISVMTYHRWRKARGTLAPVSPKPAIMTTDHAESSLPDREQMARIRELQLENSRLRRLVTDLLLEKVKLEEGIGGVPVRRTAHN
jgi:transposase-like protein